MLLSTLILPIHRWPTAGAIWRQAEQLGFHAAYTYDHLAFEGFKDGPWFGALPTLTAAATATEQLRIGTMITSPNFRHPVVLAKELATLDDISTGRLTVGIGAGSSGLDAAALGHPPWTPPERAEHFEEFVEILDRRLSADVTPTQRPRPPFTIAATGRRGMQLAARHGQGWATCPYLDGPHGPDAVAALIGEQLARLDEACHAAGRDPAELRRSYVTGYTEENPLESVASFAAVVDRYEALGITELVVHWPVAGTRFDADPAVFEAIARDRSGR